MAEYGFAIIHNPSNKLAENLDMCETCVNTHTFSPDVSRALIYLIIIYMQGRKLFIREFSALFCCFLLHLGGAGKMKNRKMKNEERRMKNLLTIYH